MNKENKKQFFIMFVLPVIFVLLGIILTIIIHLTWSEGTIITLSLNVLLNLLYQDYITWKNNDELAKLNIKELLKKLEEDQQKAKKYLLEIATNSRLRVDKDRHPYFEGEMARCREKYLSETRDISEGYRTTKDIKLETIYNATPWLSFTKKSLKAVSHSWNYSDPVASDAFKHYLDRQSELIGRGLSIVVERIIIFNDETERERESNKEIMKKQSDIGIKIFSVLKSPRKVIADVDLELDYVILDDELLVKTDCKEDNKGNYEQTITDNTVEVDIYLKRYKEIKAQSTEYVVPIN